MSISISKQEFFDRWNGDTPGNGSDLLTGNIGDQIHVKVNAYANWVVQGGGVDQDGIQFENLGGSIGTIEQLTGTFWANDSFAINDIINVSNTTSNNGLYKILSVNESIISVENYPTPNVNTFPGGSTLDNDAVINGVTPIKKIDYKANLIPNSDEPFYDSLIDDTEQSFTARGLDGTNTVRIINQSSSNAWLTGTPIELDEITGSSYVICNGVDASVGTEDGTGRALGNFQLFEIHHVFNITPEFKAEYFDANGTYRMEDLFDTESFKYSYEIDGRYEDVSASQVRRQTTNDPNSNIIQFLDFGNVGATGERLNGGEPYYSQQSVVFTDLGNAVVVDKLRASTETQVDVEVITSEANFTTGNKLDVRLYKIPVDQDDEDDNYKETTTTYYENYDYSSIFITANGAAHTPAAGADTERANHINNGATATVISTSQIDLSFTVDDQFGANKYAIVIATQDPSITDSSSTDRNNILLPVDTAEDDLSDSSVLTTTIGQLEFAQTDPANTTTSLTAFPEDNIVGVVNFAVDTAKNSLIQTISAVLVATHDTEDDFELERKDIDVSNAITSGGIQQIDVTIPRPFKMPSGDIRKDITIARDAASDTGTFAAFQMLYPYKIRWEDFIENSNVNADAFFDSAELNDGLNQDWYRIASTLGWTIKFRFEISILNDGFTNNLQSDQSIALVDYEANVDWTVAVETFNSDFSVNLGGSTYASEDTGVRATFTYTGSESITTANSYVLLNVEEYQIGGSNNIREINSLYDHESGTPWISIDGDNRAKFTDLGGNVFKAEAIISSGSFSDSPVKYSGRIGPLAVSSTTPPNAILQEDGFFWLQEDGSYIIQE